MGANLYPALPVQDTKLVNVAMFTNLDKPVRPIGIHVGVSIERDAWTHAIPAGWADETQTPAHLALGKWHQSPASKHHLYAVSVAAKKRREERQESNGRLHHGS